MDKKTINYNHKLKYDKDCTDYTLQMKRKRRPWWLLLLLLPLLLFIQCHKDVTVECIDELSGLPVDGAEVTLEYQSHHLWNEGTFFASKDIKKTQTTDEQGKTVFKDLPCSVFSYVFYCFSNMKISAKSDCHANAGETYKFHYTDHVRLTMKPRLEDLHIRVTDLETGDPLPDAFVHYTYRDGGNEKKDSVQADAAGIATIPQMRYCSMISLLRASCYGYADTIRTDVPCQDLLVANDSTEMKLRPIKERFSFFVKNKETRQPIPDAICTVVLTHPSGKKSPARTVRTSIDGKGIAVYDNAFVLATIDITAKKIHYGSGKLEGGPWTVEKFIPQPDDVRTIWLEPEPYLTEFVNVDSITGEPIPGVRNTIRITDPAGNVETVVEIGNRNGVFPVSAKEDSRVEIISEKDPDYEKKTTIIGKFKDKEVIRMKPNLVKCPFRTVKDATGYPILPGCTLVVTGSKSGTLQPDNSGNGAFEVYARIDENLSITASKQGFSTNSTTVNNTPVSSLRNGTDIPLKADPLSYVYRGQHKGQTKECYDLMEAPAEFIFSWKVCLACTMLVVTDANGNVLGRYGRNAPNGDNNGQLYSAESGTVRLKSNTQEICVTRTNVNGHNCYYQIDKQ